MSVFLLRIYIFRFYIVFQCRFLWCHVSLLGVHMYNFFYRGMQISVHIYIFYNIEIIANTQPRVIEFAQTPNMARIVHSVMSQFFFFAYLFPPSPPSKRKKCERLECQYNAESTPSARHEISVSRQPPQSNMASPSQPTRNIGALSVAPAAMRKSGLSTHSTLHTPRGVTEGVVSLVESFGDLNCRF